MIVANIDHSRREARTGRRIVLGMIAFGLLMVSLMWLYWELYTRPFRPLQNAIAAAYPGTRPSVIGGRHKSHEPGHPKILRVVLQMPMSDFNPDVEAKARDQRAFEIAGMADQHVPLSEYDELEIHLVQRPPERMERHWSISRPISEWRAILSGTSEPSSENTL